MDSNEGITIEYKDDVTIAHLYGSLGFATIKEVDDVLRKELNKKPKALALDCQYLEHLDSIAINHVVKLTREASSQNVDLMMYDVDHGVLGVLKTINLHKLIRILEKEDFEYYLTSGRLPEES